MTHPPCRHCAGDPSTEARQAHALRRAADVLDSHGASALQQTKDWQDPLKAGSLEGARGTGISDPTTAWIDRQREGSKALPPATDLRYAQLRSAIGWAYDASLTIVDIVGQTIDKLPEITRSGIGHCPDCNRYCDGTRNNRKTSVKGSEPVCDACRKKRERATTPMRHARSMITGAFRRGHGELTEAEVAELNTSTNETAG